MEKSTTTAATRKEKNQKRKRKLHEDVRRMYEECTKIHTAGNESWKIPDTRKREERGSERVREVGWMGGRGWSPTRVVG